jgi:hypothetical protein
MGTHVQTRALRWLAALAAVAVNCSVGDRSGASASASLRRCPPAERAAADVVLLVAGGRPDAELWRSVQAEAAAWLPPAAGPLGRRPDRGGPA